MAKKTTGGKSTKKARTLNAPGASGKEKSEGAPFNDQDPKWRLGNYTTAGEPHRSSGTHNR